MVIVLALCTGGLDLNIAESMMLGKSSMSLSLTLPRCENGMSECGEAGCVLGPAWDVELPLFNHLKVMSHQCCVGPCWEDKGVNNICLVMHHNSCISNENNFNLNFKHTSMKCTLYSFAGLVSFCLNVCV